MTDVQRLELAKKVAKARASMSSKGGTATLRFGAGGDQGYIASNSRLVVETLLALWNAAPDLLAETEK